MTRKGIIVSTRGINRWTTAFSLLSIGDEDGAAATAFREVLPSCISSMVCSGSWDGTQEWFASMTGSIDILSVVEGEAFHNGKMPPLMVVLMKAVHKFTPHVIFIKFDKGLARENADDASGVANIVKTLNEMEYNVGTFVHQDGDKPTDTTFLMAAIDESWTLRSCIEAGVEASEPEGETAIAIRGLFIELWEAFRG